MNDHGSEAMHQKLEELEIRPYAADDPAALPRSLGRLPGDEDGRVTEELLHLYAVLADAAEHQALKSVDR